MKRLFTKKVLATLLAGVMFLSVNSLHLTASTALGDAHSLTESFIDFGENAETNTLAIAEPTALNFNPPPLLPLPPMSPPISAVLPMPNLTVQVGSFIELQEAIANSQVGFVTQIIINDIIQFEDVIIIQTGQHITLTSGTLIHAYGVRHFEVSFGARLNLSDTVLTSLGSFGGGVHNEGTLAMFNNASIENTQAELGGGVFNANTFAMFHNSAIRHVQAENGGGVYNSMGTFFMADFSVIEQNTAISSWHGPAYGGGVSIIRGHFTMVGNATIRHNVAEGLGWHMPSIGGGVYLEYGTVVMAGMSTISHNVANGLGGGIGVHGQHPATIEMFGTPRIIGNHAISGGGVALGHHEPNLNQDNMDAPPLTVLRMRTPFAEISHNTAFGQAFDSHMVGGINPGSGGGIYVGFEAYVHILNGRIENNIAHSGGGIGSINSLSRHMHQYNPWQFGSSRSVIDIQNAQILNNTAQEDGGGICFNSYYLVFRNNVIFGGNQASQMFGPSSAPGHPSIPWHLFNNFDISYREFSDALNLMFWGGGGVFRMPSFGMYDFIEHAFISVPFDGHHDFSWAFPIEMSRPGHVFKGWVWNGQFVTPDNLFDIIPPAHWGDTQIDLHALWEPVMNIIFHDDGREFSAWWFNHNNLTPWAELWVSPTRIFPNNASPLHPIPPFGMPNFDNAFAYPNLNDWFPEITPRPGYIFKGWSVNGQDIVTYDNLFNYHSEWGIFRILYAQWEPEASPYDITRLVIGGHVGEINQENATITFNLPPHLVVNGRFAGNMDELDANSDTVIFFVGGSEWPIMEGNLVGIHTGDQVYIAGGTVYTIILNVDNDHAPTQAIRGLTIGTREGIVNQENATITFFVPAYGMTGARLAGTITHLDADTDTVIFFVGGMEWPLGQGSAVGVYNGDSVYVQGGIVYTIEIVVI